MASLTMNYEIDVQIDPVFAEVVDVQVVVQAAEATLRQQEVTEATMAIVVTDNATSQQFNREYRSIDAPTDVLSFAQQETAAHDLEGMILPPELEMDAYLGDIVIAYPYAAAQANLYQNSIESELRLLTVHGVLHLLGYDHATAKEEATMWTHQSKILDLFGERAISQQRLNIVDK